MLRPTFPSRLGLFLNTLIYTGAILFLSHSFFLSHNVANAQPAARPAKEKAAVTKLKSKAKGPAYLSIEEAAKDPQFAYQGEYKGEVTIGTEKKTVGVQVIARGKGKYRAVLYHGGLPGDGWKEGDQKEEADGEAKENITDFKFKTLRGILALNKQNKPTVDIWVDEKLIYTLAKANRQSPTLDMKAPKGAIVLFDGTSTDAFKDKTEMSEDKLLMPEAITKQKFQSFTLHAEFRSPYMPEDDEQSRGNSGIYLQNRYEIQILDTFGAECKNNYCGGFYQLHAPKVNMCASPLTWQTYDIEFTAAKYDGEKKTENARITVKHNGVVIHDNVELVRQTAGSLLKETPEPGGLLFQQHGDPVRFRNIWIVEK